MSLRRFILFGLLLGLVFFVSPFSPSVHAAGEIVVTDISDSNGTCPGGVNRPCTLRTAINTANSGGGDTISFRVTGIINLNSALPALNANMTIDGTGQKIVVNGGGAQGFRVLKQNTTVTLIHLTITNTSCPDINSGAALTNNGTVTVNDVTFDSNGNDNCFGSGIQNTNTLTVKNSTFSNNQGFYGAGIYNQENAILQVTNSIFKDNLYGTGTGIYIAEHGKVKVTRSTFSGNSTSDASYGGGIRNAGGTLNVKTSTFANNSATYGGGIYNDSGTLNIQNSTFSGNTGTTGGGGINNESGTVTVTNSTFTGNTAKALGDGGALYNTGLLDVVNSTIYGNTAADFHGYAGGIYSAGSGITLLNTIVATNSGFQCHIDDSSVTIDSYNLADDDTCGSATQKTGTELALGSLQDNGGQTKTLALLQGSAALNVGDDTVCAAPVGAPNYGAGGNDQRGITRPQDVQCDVGAYEATPTVLTHYVVNDTAITDDGACDLLGEGTGDQNCTLPEAINAANAHSGGDTITFNIPGTTGGCIKDNQCTILVSSSMPAIASNIKIDGNVYTGKITLQGVSGVETLIVNKGANLAVNALSFVDVPFDGIYDYNDGSILNNGTLNVTNSTFTAEFLVANANGTSIDNFGTVNVTNSTFIGPKSNNGARYAAIRTEGPLRVINSTIRSGQFGISFDTSDPTILRNSIVMGGTEGACFYAGSGFSADKYSIDNDGSCSGATQKTNAQINLGPLQDNGGATLTAKPGAGSAALDAGDDTVCSNAVGKPYYGAGAHDQRGANRPQGTHCDVGAFEVRVK